jgi:hypothetical protein
MALSDSDIAHLESASTASSGGAITTTGITSGVPNNVWPDVTDAERVAGVVRLRKTFWKNTNGSDSMLKPVLYYPVAPTNAAFELGLGVNSSDDTDAGQGNMAAWSAAAKVALISDTAGDTRVCTIFGLDDSGTPVPVTETLTLNGTTEVLSTNTYSKCWAVWPASIDAGKIVTVKQGTGGATRGTIGHSKKICFLWVTASSKGAGIKLPDLAPAQNYGMWRRLTVSAGAGPVRPDTLTVNIEESI